MGDIAAVHEMVTEVSQYNLELGLILRPPERLLLYIGLVRRLATRSNNADLDKRNIE